ncbi:sulfatase-like hydrolase/transferase [uncultured Draconibacterium sp.]|uniref:sulfatase family protein n=1 Tax=uncultured Draconibacterium sp. TaxID=1573823 RepID=UPI0032601ED4
MKKILSLLMVFVAANCFAAKPNKSQPHIIFIMTDQQSMAAMSYMGNTQLSTPNIDKLAEVGYSFTRNYATNPLCLPARYSIMTGYYPSKVGVRDNVSRVSPEQKEAYDKTRSKSFANLLKEAGYKTYYGGKVHLPGTEILTGSEKYGFDNLLSIDVRDVLAHKTVEALLEEGEGNTPLCMVLSFMNPHDICEYGTYARHNYKLPEKEVWQSRNLEKYLEVIRQMEAAEEYPEDEFYSSIAPPLPVNAAPTDITPIKSNANFFDEKGWKHRNWVYNRLVEEVDTEIGIVLKALMESPIWDNSIVVFTSDHGDMQGAHRLQNKPFPYEEAEVVPLIFTGGAVKKGVIDKDNLISQIDLVPTLCDFAGVSWPEDLPGVSLKPILTGESNNLPERLVYVEGKSWTQIIKDGRYKYTLMDDPTLPAMLIDLKTDPAELKNLVNNTDHQKLKQELHAELVRRNKQENLIIQ